MIEEIEASIINDLHSSRPCIPSNYVQRFPRIQANDLLRIFIGIFTRDAGIKYDLFCHLIIFSNNRMHVQNQRYSNIQRGMIMSPYGKSIQFNKSQIKQLKILAIFPNTMNDQTVEEIIEGALNMKKSKEYQNKCTILPKLIVQNKMNNNNRSKAKKEEKPKQEAKTENNEQKKNLKKTTSKSSIEMEPTKPQGLKKVSSKDQTPQPILTNYQAERKKVQEAIVEKKPKPSLKMQLDSEQDYYDPQKPEELERLITVKQVETDMSGKKDKEEKMQIEAQRQKVEKPKNFIVNDEDDDDEDEIFNKMEEIAKIPSVSQTQQSNQSQTRPKTETNKPILKKQLPKQALTAKQVPSNKPVAQTKPAASLMGWLKPKQIS